MASGIVIDKYYVRDNKNGQHLIRLDSHKKRLHIISTKVLYKLIVKYCGNAKMQQSNDFPNHPIIYDTKMIKVNLQLQKLGA